MTAYVDPIQKGKNRLTPFAGGFCHLIADTPEELDDFARQIGAPPAWRHAARVLHYDLAPHARAVAVEHGAVEIGFDEFFRLTSGRQR
jgi:hypothetical protein